MPEENPGLVACQELSRMGAVSQHGCAKRHARQDGDRAGACQTLGVAGAGETLLSSVTEVTQK